MTTAVRFSLSIRKVKKRTDNSFLRNVFKRATSFLRNRPLFFYHIKPQTYLIPIRNYSETAQQVISTIMKTINKNKYSVFLYQSIFLFMSKTTCVFIFKTQVYILITNHHKYV